jgi:outer membrane protein assembly factor BamB
LEAGVPLRAPPAVDASGRIFLHFQDRLLALKPSDAEAEGSSPAPAGGKPVMEWEYVTGARVPGPILVAADGSLRLHAADGFLHAVLPDDGKQLWPPVHVGEPLGYAAPLVDAVGNTYISSLDGGLLRVGEDGRCDKARPYLRSRQKLNSTGIIHRGVLYIGSEEGYVFAIELGDQRGRNRFDHALDQGHAGWFINSALALAEDGTIIVAGRDDNLYGFTPGGATAWKTAMPGQMLGSPVLDARGHVYVGIAQSQRGQPSRGKLLSIDGNSHKIRWQVDADDSVESTPVIGDDGIIYFGDNAGLIHAVDLSGAPKWKAKVHAPVRSAGMLVGPGKLAFGLDDETLVVLNCSSQKLPDAGWPKLAWTPRHGGPV